MTYKIFEELKITLRLYEHHELVDLAEEAGVHASTLRNWVNDNTLCPQLRTFYPVAFALGYDLKLVKQSKR